MAFPRASATRLRQEYWPHPQDAAFEFGTVTNGSAS